MFKLGNGYRKISGFIITFLSILFITWLFVSFKYIDVEKRLQVISELTDSKKYDLAYAYCLTSLNKYPDNFDIALKRADLLEMEAYESKNKKDYPDLAKSLEYVLVLNPYHRKTYDRLERIYSITGDNSLILDLKFRRENYITGNY